MLTALNVQVGDRVCFHKQFQVFMQASCLKPQDAKLDY